MSRKNVWLVIVNCFVAQQLCAGPIHDAAKNGDFAKVKMLLDKGASVEELDQHGMTPLMRAVQLGSVKLIQLFLDRNAKIEAKNKQGYTPLIRAAMHGNFDVVKLLVSNGAKLERADTCHTPLLWAATQGHLEVVKFLLDKGSKINGLGNPPLYSAASHGRAKTVQYLLEQGADINARYSGRFTAFEAARSAHKPDVLAVLNAAKRSKQLINALIKGNPNQSEYIKIINQGILCEIKNVYGSTPLNRAALLGFDKVVGLLLEKGAVLNIDHSGQTPLHKGVRSGNVGVITLLLNAGSQKHIHLKDFSGNTPLDIVRKQGIKQLVELLENSVTQSTDSLGKDLVYNEPTPTSTQQSVKRGNSESLQEMFERKLNETQKVKVQKRPKLSPLRQQELDKQLLATIRSLQGGLAKVKQLVEDGAQIEATDKNGSTPLIQAAWVGKTDVVKLLLDKDANILQTNNDGKSALDIAREKNHTEIVSLLEKVSGKSGKFGATTETKDIFDAVKAGNLGEVKRHLAEGVDVNSQDKNKNTPLHFAVQKGFVEIVKFLLDNGTNIHARTDIGYTPLHGANTLEIAAMLIEEGANVNAKGNKNKFTPLFTVKDVEVGKLLIDKGANVNALDWAGRVSLHWFAIWGNVQMAELMIDKGTDVDVRLKNRHRNDHTPLYEACWNVQIEIAKTLIDKGADVNAPYSSHKNTLLDLASGWGKSNVVMFLLTKGAHGSVKNSANIASLRKSQKTVKCADFIQLYLTNPKPFQLANACMKGDLTEVKQFVSEGVDVNWKSYNNNTPLHLAVLDGHTEVVKLLINKDADRNQKNTLGKTALDIAREKNHTEIIALLEKVSGKSKKPTATATTSKPATKTIFEAVQKGNLQEVKRHVTTGVSIESKGEQGHTPLLFAAQGGHTKIVEYLLKTGANINAQNNAKFTPLNLALLYGKFEIAELLISHGSNLDTPNYKNEGPLHHAVAKGHLLIVNRLISKGAKLDSKTEVGCTSLHLASSRGYIDIVKLLLNHGAKIDEKTPNGTTELHAAAREGRKIVVQFLLQKGANINAKNNAGKTALDIAREKKHTEIVSVLENIL